MRVCCFTEIKTSHISLYIQVWINRGNTIFRLKQVIEVGTWLYKTLTQPYLEAGKLVIDIAGKLKDTLGDLGKDSVKFLNDLGKFSEKLGNDLLKGGGEVVQNSVDALKKVGEDLVKLGDDVAKEVGKGVEDITKGLGNSLDNLGKETGNLIKGINDVTKDIGKGVQHVTTQVFKPVHNIMSGVSRTVGGEYADTSILIFFLSLTLCIYTFVYYLSQQIIPYCDMR